MHNTERKTNIITMTFILPDTHTAIYSYKTVHYWIVMELNNQQAKKWSKTKGQQSCTDTFHILMELFIKVYSIVYFMIFNLNNWTILIVQYSFSNTARILISDRILLDTGSYLLHCFSLYLVVSFVPLDVTLFRRVWFWGEFALSCVYYL